MNAKRGDSIYHSLNNPRPLPHYLTYSGGAYRLSQSTAIVPQRVEWLKLNIKVTQILTLIEYLNYTFNTFVNFTFLIIIETRFPMNNHNN